QVVRHRCRRARPRDAGTKRRGSPGGDPGAPARMPRAPLQRLQRRGRRGAAIGRCRPVHPEAVHGRAASRYVGRIAGRDSSLTALRTRPAAPADAPAIARIYNEGIEDRLATFETRHRGPEDVREWLAQGFPLVVAETAGGEVAAWASAPPYRPSRGAYAGIA